MLGRTLNNRYLLESELGRGGMGVVYLTKDLQLDRAVAVKILPPEYAHDQQFLARFRNEVLNAASMEHPNVVNVYDVGDDAGVHYYVMQFIQGHDLRAELKSRGALPLSEAARFVRDVAQALDYAHGKGIVHRDIKPENILLDRQGTARVADFGIARSLEGTRLTGGMIGTPEYMSPEQARGDAIDGRSDQYSLAILAYELVAGRPPFGGENVSPLTVLNKHISTPAPDPRLTVPGLPDGAAQALLRALEKMPEHRFPTCRDFANALTLKRASASADGAHTVIDRGSDPPPSRPVPHQAKRSVVPSFVVAILVLLAGGGWLVLRHPSDRYRARMDTSPGRPVSASAGVAGNTGTSEVGPETGDRGSDPDQGETLSGDLPLPEQDRAQATKEVRQLFERWLQVQNSLDFEAYASCYGRAFSGIKRTTSGKAYSYDYHGWLADRKKQMREARSLQVRAEDLVVTLGDDGNSATVRFTQYYRLYTSRKAPYADMGPKVMRLARESGTGAWRITYEELLRSTRL